MDVRLDGDFVLINVHTARRPFERLRRITGVPAAPGRAETILSR